MAIGWGGIECLSDLEGRRMRIARKFALIAALLMLAGLVLPGLQADEPCTWEQYWDACLPEVDGYWALCSYQYGPGAGIPVDITCEMDEKGCFTDAQFRGCEHLGGQAGSPCNSDWGCGFDTQCRFWECVPRV